MKTNHYLTLTALIAVGLASCTSEDLVNEIAPTEKTNVQTVMSFDVHTKNQTRAAAGALQSSSYYDFGVWAYKKMPSGTTGGEYQEVMPNYLVGYYDESGNNSYYGNGTATIGDANSTTEGLSMWFYVGLGKNEYTHAENTGFKTSSPSVNNGQELKYWDYNSTSTDFFAYAPYGNGDLYEFSTTNSDTVITTQNWVWAGFSNQNYQEKLLAYTNVAKSDYGNDVQLQFKRINAAVQLAFYAPIPGFDTQVTAVSAECAHLDGNNSIVTDASDKVAYGSKVKIGTNGVIEVIASDRYHIATSETEPDGTPNTFGVPAGTTVQNNFHGVEVTGESYKNLAKIIGKTNEASALSYSPNTFYAMPASTEEADKNSGFKVSVEFKIYSQSGTETQNLQGEVFISPEYTQWKSNYKYVYIFKLTHNTPIVFDGISVSEYNIETIPADWTVVGTSNP